ALLGSASAPRWRLPPSRVLATSQGRKNRILYGQSGSAVHAGNAAGAVLHGVQPALLVPPHAPALLSAGEPRGRRLPAGGAGAGGQVVFAQGGHGVETRNDAGQGERLGVGHTERPADPLARPDLPSRGQVVDGARLAVLEEAH